MLYTEKQHMKKRKQQLAASIALLTGAVLILAGCSWESAPVAKDAKPAELPLDKLKRDEADRQLAEAAKKKEQEKEAVKPVTPAPAMTGKQYPSAPAMSINPAKKYVATLHTEKGDIKVELNAKEMPQTVNSFVFLVREKFYDGLVFHRAMNGFMIQGGDPLGSGIGNPGYKVTETPAAKTAYDRGVIAMAKGSAEPAGTSGSQFFIMHADYPLPADYAAFGKVVSGLDVVDAIATAPAVDNGYGEKSKPVTPVKITSVDIVEQ